MAVGTVIVGVILAGVRLWLSSGGSQESVQPEEARSSPSSAAAVKSSVITIAKPPGNSSVPEPSGPAVSTTPDAVVASVPELAHGRSPLESSTQPLHAKVPPFRLQGIYFSGRNAFAIINGKIVRVHETIADAQVVAIHRTSVVLEYQQQRTTLSMR